MFLVPQVFTPSRGSIRPGCAIPNSLKTFPEPSFAERGPTPNIEAACFPGRNLGPPRQVHRLIALACPGVSEEQFVKCNLLTGQYLVPPNEVKPLALVELVIP